MGLSQHTTGSKLIKEELDQLESELVLLEGHMIKPSQCYHFSADPIHVLYNTNCPTQLKQKIEAILTKYKNNNESSS